MKVLIYGSLIWMSLQFIMYSLLSSFESEWTLYPVPKPDNVGLEAMNITPFKHWGVITTIFTVNPAVTHFATELPNVGLVIVGDHKTNDTEWDIFAATHSNAIYLSPQSQRQLPYHIMEHVPWNHFGRKAVGFLFAIHHGADQIFDFDDDNHLITSPFSSFPAMQRLDVLTKHHIYWNPYNLYLSALLEMAETGQIYDGYLAFSLFMHRSSSVYWDKDHIAESLKIAQKITKIQTVVHGYNALLDETDWKEKKIIMHLPGLELHPSHWNFLRFWFKDNHLHPTRSARDDTWCCSQKKTFKMY